MDSPPQSFSVLKVTSQLDIDGELQGSKREANTLTIAEITLKLNLDFKALRCSNNYLMYSLDNDSKERFIQETYCIGKDETPEVKALWDYILRSHALKRLN